MPLSLVAVDPGKHDCGIALFLDGKLVAAAYLAPKPGGPYEVAKMAAAWVHSESLKRPGVTTASGKVNTLVVEGQQIYGGTRSKVDPNDLIPLAEVVGGVKARIDAFTIMHPLPREWTGGVPKEVRHRRLFARLDQSTLDLIATIKAPKGSLHNAVDAITLGYWAIGIAKPEPERGYTQ